MIGLVVVLPDQRVDVRVDQTRKDRGRTEVDDPGVSRDDLDISDRNDLLALDQDRQIVTDLIAFAVDQMCSNNRNRLRRDRRRRAGEEEQNKDNYPAACDSPSAESRICI